MSSQAPKINSKQNSRPLTQANYNEIEREE